MRFESHFSLFFRLFENGEQWFLGAVHKGRLVDFGIFLQARPSFCLVSNKYFTPTQAQDVFYEQPLNRRKICWWENFTRCVKEGVGAEEREINEFGGETSLIAPGCSSFECYLVNKEDLNFEQFWCIKEKLHQKEEALMKYCKTGFENNRFPNK